MTHFHHSHVMESNYPAFTERNGRIPNVAESHSVFWTSHYKSRFNNLNITIIFKIFPLPLSGYLYRTLKEPMTASLTPSQSIIHNHYFISRYVTINH
jgi:hypothetical protein